MNAKQNASASTFLFGSVLFAVFLAGAPSMGASPVLPEGLGVNIHFTDPRTGELEMLAGAGFKIVRMDLGWAGTERQRGVYDFAAFDRLVRGLDQHNLHALFILDYSNKLYDEGLSPHSDEGRAAFARWAVAAATHFKGRNILWEMYNEPNIGFWKPKPSVDDYIKLALAVGKALRESVSDERYIGPATSTIDFAFLEACFKAGLLEYWSAVSVHPYRQSAPETVAEEYGRLRGLIAKYAPSGKQLPILSGEWGYSAAWKNFDESRQATYFPRQLLTNVANDVPVSIWYDWHDDGEKPAEPEHHFGTVHFPYHPGRDILYDPKPVYFAAKTLTSFLTGFRFIRRLETGRGEDYVLEFVKADDAGAVRLAVWTTAVEPHAIVIPASAGAVYDLTGADGQSLPSPHADSASLHVTLSDQVHYLAKH